MSYFWSNSIDRKGDPKLLKVKTIFFLFLLYFFFGWRMGIDPSRSNPRCRRRWFQSNISHRTVRMARAPRYSNRLAGGILGAVAMACNKRQHFVLVEVIISEKTNWNCSYGRNINYKKLIRVLEIESHRLAYYFLLSYPKKSRTKEFFYAIFF